MRRCTIILLVIATFLASQVTAGDNLFDQFQKYAESEIDQYATPVVEAFGTGISGGLYHTARTHGTLGFDIGVRAMLVLIPEGKGAILDSADIKVFPVPVLQASVGLPIDLEVMARGFSIKFQDQTISLFGAGVKKNFSSYIPVPGFPSVSAMVAYHHFKAGSYLSSSTISFDAIVSKKFLVIAPYAGFGYDRTSMKVTYTYVPASPLPEVPVSHTVKVSTTRFTLGLSITPAPFVNVFADYNFGKFAEVSTGLSIGFR
jgi:hypothetical protein